MFGLSKCKIVVGSPNVAEANTTSVDAGQIWTGTTFPNDQCSEFTINSMTQELNTYAVLAVRMQTGSFSGYRALLQNNLYGISRYDSGTQTTLIALTATTIANGDIWSFQAIGSTLVLFRNGVPIAFAIDATYPSGAPGFDLFTTVNITHSQISSWRGYSAVQADGIWTKQGAVLPALSGDINPAHGNSGTYNASRVLFEGNAQILSGTVYKMWFTAGSGIGYAESLDGISWTRFGSLVLAGQLFPNVIKVSSTYYMYTQVNTAVGTGAFNVYTSSNGTSWTSLATSILSLGTAGAWDDTNIYSLVPVYVDGGGTWWFVYTGIHSTSLGLGVATSTDGQTLTKYVSNPVASGIWATTPMLFGSTWYMWSGSSQVGQESGANFFDPVATVRSSASALTGPWTKNTNALHRSQLDEGVNGMNGSSGFSYADFAIDVGGQTYMYYDGGPGDIAGGIWQVNLAIAPANLEAIIRFGEDATVQVASDAFTNGPGPLSASWTTQTGAGAPQIVSGPFVQAASLGTAAIAVYTGSSFSNDQYSEVTIQALTNSSQFAFPIVRAATGAKTFYQCAFNGATGTRQTTATITKFVSGSSSALTGGLGTASFTPHVGDVMRLSAVGNVLSLYQNGFLILQSQDYDSAISSGSPGIAIQAATSLANAEISLWGGGNAGVVPNYPTAGQVGAILVGP